jgi:hypothetical protein
MNTIETNVTTHERELSDAELGGVAGGWTSIAGHKYWNNLSKEDRIRDNQAYPSLSPSQQAAYNHGEGLPPS